MSLVQVTISIPADLAEQAEEFSLFEPQEITALLRAEIDRRVMDMVNEEIQAYRRETRMEDQDNASQS